MPDALDRFIEILGLEAPELLNRIRSDEDSGTSYERREQEQALEREKLRQQALQQLAQEGYVFDNLLDAAADAEKRNYRNGAYHHDPSKPLGSIDNPYEVGMEGCCDHLFFDYEHFRCWCLTDGLGNGWIR